ncbi:hypothetical protein ABPG75_012765 [Micractinium tetrahymenae]
MAAPPSLLARFAAALQRCGVRPVDRLAVALSGGPDSLALAAMTVQWQQQQPVTECSQQAPLALIVDHNLRPESSAEAAAVAAQAAQLGLAPQVLPVAWPGGMPPRPGDKMAAARDARYALLLAACAAAGGRHLLLAHHADDQAETFLLRLLHASGVAGLACMPPAVERQTEHGPVTLARPLLGFRKAELEAVCRRSGLPFVVDPTNADLAFQRNRIRHLLQRYPLPPAESSSSNNCSELAAEGQGHAAGASSSRASSNSGSGHRSCGSIVGDLLLLQRRCEAVARQQGAAAAQLLRRAVLDTSCTSLLRGQQQADSIQKPGHPPNANAGNAANLSQPMQQLQAALQHLGYAVLDVGCLAQAEEPVAQAALSTILQAVSGQPYPPGLAQLARLHAFLQEGRPGSSFTGSGCLVRHLGRSWGRRALCVAQADQTAAAAALAAAKRGKQKDSPRSCKPQGAVYM